ncbi:MAG: hypothetical protein EZS28_002214 [Streblomastix strix]|uniref:MYND-type domain-containing protein n=1 Tax=Streblomastix strix TaxID=222440 RepID=A0A5J4X4U5_9EUKA|nr:MAG: hypothetical protein EZS28_002213 [Streblomastix strix]KAA6402252.1 MAG: hypothetical protein EZS28_002214 [Streblomastix strix]
MDEFGASQENFLIQFSEKFGYEAVAPRDMVPGDELIAAESAFAYSLANLKICRCANCIKKCESDKIMRCSKCKKVKYCSKECQKAHWKFIHKIECNLLQIQTPQPIEGSMLLALRTLLKYGQLKQSQDDEQCTDIMPGLDQDGQRISPDDSTIELYNIQRLPRIHYFEENDILRLICNDDKFEAEKKDTIKATAHILTNLIGNPNVIDQNIAEQIINRLGCTAISAYDEEMMGVTMTALYPRIALFFNHSCRPNCTAVFWRTGQEKIFAQEGRNILERATQLWEKKEEGSEQNASDILQELLNYINSLKDNNQTDNKEEDGLIKPINRQCYLHEFHEIIFQSKQLLFHIFIDQQKFNEALLIGQQLMNALEAYHENYPSLIFGMSVAQQAKLEWLFGNSSEAYKLFKKAVEILSISHGQESSIVISLRSQLNEAEAEVRMRMRAGNE